MSKQIDDGGSAFPVAGYINEHGNEQPGDYGMTLRDWFAGQALANPRICPSGWPCHLDAQRAYKTADAMLAARKEPTDE